MTQPPLRLLKELRSGRIHAQVALVVTILLAACQGAGSSRALERAGAPSMEAARQSMVEYAVRQAGVTDERVLRSMRVTERHEFVPREMKDRAYDDAGVPIGKG
ncbi:MAG: hypothetical protein ACJAQ3_000844, partial [Planctomycetota bacterium]